MTDQELEDFLAKEVMGWELDCLDTAHERSDLFEGWMLGDYVAVWRHSWHPLTGIVQAWQVLERVTDPFGLGGKFIEGDFPMSVATHVMYQFTKANLWAYDSQEAARKICEIAFDCVKRADFAQKGV
jgi:hypothetical protein